MGRPDLAAIRANWGLGAFGTYTNLHVARAETVNLLLDYAEALERERDTYREALLPFARAQTVRWLDSGDTAVVVPRGSVERARALLAGGELP